MRYLSSGIHLVIGHCFGESYLNKAFLTVIGQAQTTDDLNKLWFGCGVMEIF